MSAWFDRFFEGLYARVLLGQFDEAGTLSQAGAVKRLLRARKGQRVLDIPCGTGRLTVPLARMGLVMTGVDLTPAYIRRARRVARKSRMDVRFIQGDMRDIGFVSEFDAAFNWFGSFGYFSDADNLAFARRVFQALKPGGRFLVDGPHKSWLLAHWRERRESNIAGVRILQSSRWDARRLRAVTTWTMCRGRLRECHRSSMRIYDAAEMRALLREAGFRDVRLYDGWRPVGPFTRHSRRMIAVGTRPRL